MRYCREICFLNKAILRNEWECSILLSLYQKDWHPSLISKHIFWKLNIKNQIFSPLYWKENQFECMSCCTLKNFTITSMEHLVAPSSITFMKQSLSSFEGTHNPPQGSRLRTLNIIPTLGLFSIAWSKDELFSLTCHGFCWFSGQKQPQFGPGTLVTLSRPNGWHRPPKSRFCRQSRIQRDKGRITLWKATSVKTHNFAC